MLLNGWRNRLQQTEGRSPVILNRFLLAGLLLLLHAVVPPVCASPLKHRALPPAKQKPLPRAHHTCTRTGTHTHKSFIRERAEEVGWVLAMTSAVVKRWGDQRNMGARKGGVIYIGVYFIYI